MSKQLTKEQQAVWDKLKDPFWNQKFDVESMTFNKPAFPKVGAVWLDQGNDVFVYDGKKWRSLTSR